MVLFSVSIQNILGLSSAVGIEEIVTLWNGDVVRDMLFVGAIHKFMNKELHKSSKEGRVREMQCSVVAEEGIADFTRVWSFSWLIECSLFEVSLVKRRIQISMVMVIPFNR